MGDRVRLQNVATKEFILKGTIELLRTTNDGRVVSYDIVTDKGYTNTRHRRYLRPLHPEHDPKIPKVDKNTKAEAIKLDDNTCDETKETTVLPTADHNAAESREETGYKPRRSSRNRAVIDKPQGDIITSEAVKAVRIMGNRCSNCAWLVSCSTVRQE